MEIGFGEGLVPNGIEGPVLSNGEGRQRPGLSRLLPSSLARRCPPRWDCAADFWGARGDTPRFFSPPPPGG